MNKKDLIKDFEDIWYLRGYHECKFEYCRKDEYAMEEQFEELIVFCKRYDIDYKEYLKKVNNNEMNLWEAGELLESKIINVLREKLNI